MFRAHADDDAGLLCGHEAEAMLDENAVGAVLSLTAIDQLLQHLFRHGQVGAVVDAGDGPPYLHAAHDAEELDLGTLPGLELGGGGGDGVWAENETGGRHEEEGRKNYHRVHRETQRYEF